MKVSRDNAINELSVAIDWFKIKGYIRTVGWLLFIQQNIKEGNPTEFKQDIQDTLSGYKSDVKTSGGYTEACNKIIQAIYAGLLNKGVSIFRDTLEDAYPFIQNWRVTQANLVNMTELTREPSMSLMARYYLYLFGYLIAVEGSYSNWIKILYRLVCRILDLPDDSSTIEDWKPYKVQNKLVERNPEFDILFDGYHRGNLRNAISHGDFSYDNENEIMHFKHIYKGELKFDEMLSFDEFYESLKKIMTVTDTGIEIIFLLRLLSYGHLLP